jgi:hypothetical protein
VKTTDIMAKHGFPVNYLKVLSELYGSKLITREEVEKNIHFWGHRPIQFCKETVTVDQTVTVMKKHDISEPTCKLLKILSELYGSRVDNKRGSRKHSLVGTPTKEHSLLGTPTTRQNTGTYTVSQRC